MSTSQHSDLMGLMLPYFSGTKDDFERGIAQLPPMLFDRINEGQPFSADFFLSRLPFELVWNIIKLVDGEDLGALAVVNRDCLQLARSRQFTTITLDHSDSAVGILDILADECEQRSKNASRTRTPSVGHASARSMLQQTLDGLPNVTRLNYPRSSVA